MQKLEDQLKQENADELKAAIIKFQTLLQFLSNDIK